MRGTSKGYMSLCINAFASWMKQRKNRMPKRCQKLLNYCEMTCSWAEVLQFYIYLLLLIQVAMLGALLHEVPYFGFGSTSTC